MTLDEYVGRFRLLLHGAEQDERRLTLLSAGAYRSFLDRFGDSDSPALSAVMISEERIRAGMEKKIRLSRRYADRLAAAISRMEAGALREYALYHFLYGLTHEEIADQSFFCVRTVYRYARKARAELEKAMRQVKPKAIRTKGEKYRIRGSLPRRRDTFDRIARSVAACSALRRRESYRDLVLFA